ncbi:MAG TPA: hypothetical protein DCS92_01300 [Gammaproteobacteria bacterium]|nr:hypothetical protein [Gammaproteobacteria bacterium]
MASFLSSNNVQIVASLPCYIEQNVDNQRGNNVFQKSIKALRLLNSLGYGEPSSNLILNLVYNPLFDSLPPPQDKLEQEYKYKLNSEFGIKFNNLYTITNMPINRFEYLLKSQDKYNEYMNLLLRNYNSSTLSSLMCKHTISVNWNGEIYDCDFNQQLNIPLRGNQRMHLIDLNNAVDIDQPIAVADHCFGCTAGQGSSCAGALAGAQL